LRGLPVFFVIIVRTTAKLSDWPRRPFRALRGDPAPCLIESLDHSLPARHAALRSEY